MEESNYAPDPYLTAVWLFNTKTGALQPERITPYPYTSIVILPAQKVAVFVANNDIWRVNLDGSGLKRLTTSGDIHEHFEPLLPWDK